MALFIRKEKIHEFLESLSPLVDRYTSGDYSFPLRTIDWLKSAEELMSGLRLAEGAEMSALRGRIMKAGDQARDDEGRRTRKAVRLACSAAAAESLGRAEEILRHRMLEAEDKLGHYEEKLTEAMTAASLVNVIPLPPIEPRERWLRIVWQAISRHQAIRPTTTYLAAALTSVDRLSVLDSVMVRLMEKDMGIPEGEKK